MIVSTVYLKQKLFKMATLMIIEALGNIKCSIVSQATKNYSCSEGILSNQAQHSVASQVE